MQSTLGFELDYLDREQLADRVRSARYGGGLYEPGSFHFHPLRHIRELARTLVERSQPVFVRTPVESIHRVNGRWNFANGASQNHQPRTGSGHRRLRSTPLSRSSTGAAANRHLYRGNRGHLARAWMTACRSRSRSMTTASPSTTIGRCRIAVCCGVGGFPLPNRSPTSIRRLMRRDLARVFPSTGRHSAGSRLGRLDELCAPRDAVARADFSEGLWHGPGFSAATAWQPRRWPVKCWPRRFPGDTRRLDAFKRWPPRWAGGLARTGRGPVSVLVAAGARRLDGSP